MSGSNISENIRSDWIDDQIKQIRADESKKSGEENSSLRKLTRDEEVRRGDILRRKREIERGRGRA